MSALPKAVRAQVEKSNQLADEYTRSLNGETPPGETPPGETPPSETPTESDWEQRYKSLQGKYNAEVPRLQTQAQNQSEAIQNLQQQLTATQNLLASFSAQRETALANSQPETPSGQVKLVKDEEIREFGPDLIDLVRRVAREENATLMPEFDRRMAPVAQRVNQVAEATQQVGARVAQNDQQSVHAQLTAQVPNWQELNREPEFLAWLDEVDPYAGAQRGALLRQAYKAHDGPRVVAFFTGYLKEHAAVTPPAKAGSTAPAATRRTLDQYVAPGTPKPGSASTPDGSGKRVWTRPEIGAFYSDIQAGRFKGTAEDRKRMEADIFAAQREGRIR